MPLLIFLFWLIVGILLWKSENKARDNRFDAAMRNTENGKMEYVIAWNIFQQLTQEVYKEGAAYFQHKQKIVGIYDREFEEVGVYLYGRDPADEAVVRAKKIMLDMGRELYTASWSWDERKKCVSSGTYKDQHENPESLRNMYRRPDITWDLFDSDSHSVAYKDQYFKPPRGDNYRKRFFVCSDGHTLCALQDNNFSSIAEWKWRGQKMRSISNYYQVEMNGYKIFLYHQQQKQFQNQ